MSFFLTVLYPENEDTIFHLKYYLDHHMPLAEKIWRPFGFQGWKLVEAVAGPDGKKGPFRVFNAMTWKDPESYAAAAAAPESAEIWDDLPNVCNYAPTVVSGKLLASG